MQLLRVWRRDWRELAPRVARDAIPIPVHLIALHRRRRLHSRAVLRVSCVVSAREDGADARRDPRIRDAHDARVGHVRVRDAVAHVRGVARELEIFLVAAVFALRAGRLAALDVGRAQEQAPGLERRRMRLLVQAVIENVDRQRAAQFGRMSVEVADHYRPANPVRHLNRLIVKKVNGA